MGKVVSIKKARKEHKCSKCGAVIKVGQPYKKGVINFHPDIIRCVECGLKSYEVTTSEYRKEVGAICEDWYGIHGCDENTVDNIVETLRDLLSQCEDNLENMPESLRESSSTGETLQSRIDNLEEVIDELEQISSDDLRREAEESATDEIGEDGFDTEVEREEAEREEAIDNLTQELFEESLSSAIEEAISSLEY